MTVVGLSFSKVSVEKKADVSGKISLNTNCVITNLEKIDLVKSPGHESLKASFEYKAEYEPGAAFINFLGEILFLEKLEDAEKSLKGWKKDKNVGQELTMRLMPTIIGRCNIVALIVTRELNLPPPFPLPRVEFKPEPVKK